MIPSKKFTLLAGMAIIVLGFVSSLPKNKLNVAAFENKVKQGAGKLIQKYDHELPARPAKN